MRQKLIKTIIPIAMVLLLLGTTLSSGISAENSETNQEHKLTIFMRGVTNDNYKIEAKISQEHLDEFNSTIDDFMVLVDVVMDENSSEGSEITASEWEDIETSVFCLIDIIKVMVGEGFPEEEIKSFISSVIISLHGVRYHLRQPLLSVGIGITWVPFYEYETFLGKMIKPVFIRHIFGFSGTCKLNPFVLGFPCYKFGRHRVRTFFFQGILINFGDLGVNRLIGPQLLIGYGFFTGFA